jgi:hypothetical protein
MVSALGVSKPDHATDRSDVSATNRLESSAGVEGGSIQSLFAEVDRR